MSDRRDVEVRPLSLAAGFALAARDTDDRGPVGPARWRGEVARAAATAMDVLGAQTAWSDLSPARVASVWRALARRHAETGQGGPRQALQVVSALYATARWLRNRGHIPDDACLPRAGWRRFLAADWAALSGRRPPPPARPQHTPAEVRALLAALPRADPRIRLAVELGAELRLGQVLRAARRALVLSPAPESPAGHLDVRGAGRKGGGVVSLTPEQRAAVDAALNGYLAEYEAAFVAGAIYDYPLFPGGKLARGQARRRDGPTPLERRSALRLFHALERAAGVEPVPGRGWYGLRRAATHAAS